MIELLIFPVHYWQLFVFIFLYPTGILIVRVPLLSNPVASLISAIHFLGTFAALWNIC
jgi:hypothetical protein